MNVTKAQAESELRRMRSALSRWLTYRQRVDDVLAGRVPAKVSPTDAKSIVVRDIEGEQALATGLHALLSQAYDSVSIPNADVRANPNAAVELARIVISGTAPAAAAPQAVGFLPLVPLLVGAGALVLAFSITSAIRNRAEVQMHKEEIECIKLGACVDWRRYAILGGLGLAGFYLYKRTSRGGWRRR